MGICYLVSLILYLIPVQIFGLYLNIRLLVLVWSFRVPGHFAYKSFIGCMFGMYCPRLSVDYIRVGPLLCFLFFHTDPTAFFCKYRIVLITVAFRLILKFSFVNHLA